MLTKHHDRDTPIITATATTYLTLHPSPILHYHLLNRQTHRHRSPPSTEPTMYPPYNRAPPPPHSIPIQIPPIPLLKARPSPPPPSRPLPPPPRRRLLLLRRRRRLQNPRPRLLIPTGVRIRR